MNTKEEKFTIKKSAVECYKIRHSRGMKWADITIDSNEKGGRISIASDCGSWQYYWNACNESFKSFLIGLDIHYVAGKFGCSNWFDIEKTISEYTAVITENINDAYLSKDDGEEALEEVKSLSACANQEEFFRELGNCSQIMRLYDHCPGVIYGINPAFRNFWTLIWPEFINEIKCEIKEQNKYRGLPDSIQEALNSGDGVYRP